MGHDGACVYDDADHPQPCRTYVVPPPVDLTKTRFWEIDGDYWRTNATAPEGIQVEVRGANGRWRTDETWATEEDFLRMFGHVVRPVMLGEVS